MSSHDPTCTNNMDVAPLSCTVLNCRRKRGPAPNRPTFARLVDGVVVVIKRVLLLSSAAAFHEYEILRFDFAVPSLSPSLPEYFDRDILSSPCEAFESLLFVSVETYLCPPILLIPLLVLLIPLHNRRHIIRCIFYNRSIEYD